MRMLEKTPLIGLIRRGFGFFLSAVASPDCGVWRLDLRRRLLRFEGGLGAYLGGSLGLGLDIGGGVGPGLATSDGFRGSSLDANAGIGPLSGSWHLQEHQYTTDPTSGMPTEVAPVCTDGNNEGDSFSGFTTSGGNVGWSKGLDLGFSVTRSYTLTTN